MRQLQVVWVFKLQPKLQADKPVLISNQWLRAPGHFWAIFWVERTESSGWLTLQGKAPLISHHWFEINTSTGRPNIMGLYLGWHNAQVGSWPTSDGDKVCAFHLTHEPLVLIPDPIASKMLDSALPENWIWDQLWLQASSICRSCNWEEGVARQLVMVLFVSSLDQH